MSEAELIDQMIARQEIIWNLNQWWVSISLAVMLAAYVTSERLNRILVTLIVVMYSLYTFTLWEHVVALATMSSAYSEALSALAESSQLSTVGYAMIEQRAGRPS